CLESEDTEEVGPPSVLDTLVQTSLLAGAVVLKVAILVLLRCRTAAQVGRLDRLDVDHVVGTHEVQRRRVVEGVALPLDVLVLALEQGDCLATALAPLLASSDPTLRSAERLLRLAVVPRVLGGFPVGGDEKDLQPNIDAGLASRRRERFDGHVGARDTGIPAVCLAADGDRLGGAAQRTMESHGDA